MLFTREFYRAIVYFCTKCRIDRSDAIRGIREAFPMFDYTDKVIGDWFRNIKTLDDVISKKHQRSSRINDQLMRKIIFEVRKSPTSSSRSIGKKVKASHSTVDVLRQYLMELRCARQSEVSSSKHAELNRIHRSRNSIRNS